jgi:hypothetical protein
MPHNNLAAFSILPPLYISPGRVRAIAFCHRLRIVMMAAAFVQQFE